SRVSLSSVLLSAITFSRSSDATARPSTLVRNREAFQTPRMTVGQPTNGRWALTQSHGDCCTTGVMACTNAITLQPLRENRPYLTVRNWVNKWENLETASPTSGYPMTAAAKLELRHLVRPFRRLQVTDTHGIYVDDWLLRKCLLTLHDEALPRRVHLQVTLIY